MSVSELRDRLARARFNRPAAIACTLLFACSNDRPRETHTPRSIVADVIVAVSNETAHDKHIVLEVGTVEHALGDVPSHSSRSFSLPSSAGDSTSELVLEARQGRDTTGLRSGIFHISSGQRVVWTLNGREHGALVAR